MHYFLLLEESNEIMDGDGTPRVLKQNISGSRLIK